MEFCDSFYIVTIERPEDKSGRLYLHDDQVFKFLTSDIRDGIRKYSNEYSALSCITALLRATEKEQYQEVIDDLKSKDLDVVIYEIGMITPREAIKFKFNGLFGTYKVRVKFTNYDKPLYAIEDDACCKSIYVKGKDDGIGINATIDKSEAFGVSSNLAELYSKYVAKYIGYESECNMLIHDWFEPDISIGKLESIDLIL